MHFFPIVSSDHALQDLCNAQCSAVSNDCSCDEGRGVVPGITVGHEMVGVVEEIGAEVTFDCKGYFIYGAPFFKL